jgi:hypothetical protein
MRQYSRKYCGVYFVYWLVVFLLYLPAAKAGRVGDFPGWVNTINSQSLFDYINRKGFCTPSMYQFTQVITYLFYKVFGAHAWPWHLLHVSVQAFNALLLFVFFKKLFINSSVNRGGLVAYLGSFLFCVCPHISEAVVWEPGFHFLLGLLLMLAVLHCAQKFLIAPRVRYAWLGAIFFFLSTYSLEVFYLTPFFVITLVIYYRNVLGNGKEVTKKILLYFTLPQTLLFIMHLILLKVIYNDGIAHIGSATALFSAGNFSKVSKYIFHILFFGRFFSDEVRRKVYEFCSSGLGLSLFYGLLGLVFIYIIARYKKINTYSKPAVLVFIWSLASLGLVLPLWFPDGGLVLDDRYTYVPAAFIYVLVALLLDKVLRKRPFLPVMLAYALVNCLFTCRIAWYWQQSARIVNNLVSTFPNDPGKKVLLLDLPECLEGVQMIGSRDEGEFRMLYNAVMPEKITNIVYDVEAFYMRSDTEGAHVTVIDDSTARVTLNQWGTWWVYYDYGAYSYQNADYKVIMTDAGHRYDVVLKNPASGYLLLFGKGKEWRKVDWDKKNIDQY